jgi:hypothetical protein
LVKEWRSVSITSVVVDWETASELNTVGFNLYRSESLDGQYYQINVSLIPASPDPLVGGEYSYLDDDVEAGLTYYYKLEELDSKGDRWYFGPIEIQASSQGWQIILLGGFVILSGIIGLFYSYWRRHKMTQELLEN